MTRLIFSKTDFLKAAIGDAAWHGKGVFEAGAEHFLRAYYDDAEQNDAIVLSQGELLTLARNFWMFGQTRKIGRPSVNVRPADDVKVLGARYDVVEIITDDQKFLVDSIIGEISTHGLDIIGLFHPVVTGFRNGAGNWTQVGTPVAESMVQVLIHRQTKLNREKIKTGILDTLNDLGSVIHDFKPMIELLDNSITELSSRHGNVAKDVLDEACEFLMWLRDGNFVLLGTRRYNYQQVGNKYDYANPDMIKKSCLGILRDQTRLVLRQSNEPANISSNAEAFLSVKEPVTVAKSNLFSRVHRRVRMDYISVKHYTDEGVVCGKLGLQVCLRLMHMGGRQNMSHSFAVKWSASLLGLGQNLGLTMPRGWILCWHLSHVMNCFKAQTMISFALSAVSPKLMIAREPAYLFVVTPLNGLYRSWFMCRVSIIIPRHDRLSESISVLLLMGVYLRFTHYIQTLHWRGCTLSLDLILMTISPQTQNS
ncbi:MAG: NAD-glutamate dehydrogenase [Robiginitomaculum sp.]|nr:NAD-glutamate dehydrogenase [Robiginitomaculum sp.]